ncbi:MAG: zinc ribbon domain-containing protein [Candidatus Paceibacterota bacterium]|jgi:DNA-directed RNA polymerase subunit RPC12/RpoP
MSLIKCSECGKEISDKAVSCPSCGNPTVTKSPEIVEDKKIVEVELTGKKWKGRFMWGMVLFLGGWMMLYVSVGFGVFIMFIGVVMVITAKIGSWWTNG